MNELIHIPTYPRKPHQGLRPLGCCAMFFDTDAALFLHRLSRVSAQLPADLADMHRLVYLGEPFRKEQILRCLRLSLGRRHATWIEGQIEMLAAEEAAQKPEDHQL